MQIGMRLIRATCPGMARGLLRLGQQAAAYNRTFAKVQELAADGAESVQTLFGLTEELTPYQAVRPLRLLLFPCFSWSAWVIAETVPWLIGCWQPCPASLTVVQCERRTSHETGQS